MIQISIWSDINSETSLLVKETLKVIENDEEPLLIYINSPGGSLTDAVAICNLLESIKNPITTVALGACCSAACMIFACGDNRVIGKDILYMIHQPYVITGEEEINHKTSKERTEHMKQCLDIYKNSLIPKTELPQSIIDDLVKNGKDVYINQKNCLKYKIATHKFETEEKLAKIIGVDIKALKASITVELEQQ